MNKQKVKWFKAGYDKAKKEDLKVVLTTKDYHGLGIDEKKINIIMEMLK